MHKTELKALVAIEVAPGGDATRQNDTYAVLDEVCRISGKLRFDLQPFGAIVPRIRRLRKRSVGKESKRWFDRVLPHSEVIQISLVVPFSGREVAIAGDLPETHRIEMYRLGISSIFQQQVSNVLVAANLSRPGSIEVKEAALFRDRRHADCEIPQVDPYVLQRAVDFSTKAGWPKLHKLPFAKVWEWLNAFKDFSQVGFSESQIGRSLCAFSRILEYSETDEPMHLPRISQRVS